MQNTLTHTFDQLDLTHPEDLLIAFHYLRSWPTIEPFPELKAYLEQLEIIQHYAPLIFGQPDDMNSAASLKHLMLDLGGTEPGNHPGAIRALAPRTWMYVWREASCRELIGPIAFGAAFRFFAIGNSGNAVPEQAADSLEARRALLCDARCVSPEGVMDHDERAVLARLPNLLTLYRGGCSAYGEIPLDRARSLYWALDYDYAALHMRARGAARSLAAANVTPETIRNLSLADRKQWARVAGARPGMLKDQGQPYLLRATMPKELILAYAANGAFGQLLELIVDFDKITADMVEDITPVAYRWAA